MGPQFAMVEKHTLTGNSAGMSGFCSLANAGFYVALRVGFAYPIEERNALPPAWVARYTQRGMMLQDPVIRWVYANSGSARWSDINLADPSDVFGQARRFDLNFGAAVSYCESDSLGQRSYGSFARHDREFTKSEILQLSELLIALHDDRCPPTNLTNAELEALRMVKDGLLMKEIADLLGVTEGAVKQRLKNAKLKLRAKTGTHAATKATSFGLI
jgi:LuxR family transcriptional regulator